MTATAIRPYHAMDEIAYQASDGLPSQHLLDEAESSLWGVHEFFLEPIRRALDELADEERSFTFADVGQLLLSFKEMRLAAESIVEELDAIDLVIFNVPERLEAKRQRREDGGA
jgi:hypothetical protein